MHDEWHQWRQAGIGGSDVAAILGLSPWQSAYSVWLSKLGTPDDRDTPAMEFGRRAEAMIAPWFTDLTGLHVAGEQTWAQHPDPAKAFMRCTVDGFVMDGPNSTDIASALGVLEIKTTSDTADEWAERIPVYYQTQAQHTLTVTSMERLWFAVLHLAFGRPELQVYEVAADPADQRTIEQAISRFWHDHVLAKVPPAVDAHPATTAALKATPAGVDTITASADLVATCQTLTDLKARAKDLEAEITYHENTIRAELDTAVAANGPDGNPVVTWKPQDTARLDATALRKAHPHIADLFTTTTTSRVLRLKKGQ